MYEKNDYNHPHIWRTWCCETFLLVGSLKEVSRSGERKLLLFYEQVFHTLNVVLQPNKFHSQMVYLSRTNTTILTFVCSCTRKINTNILTFGKLDVVRLLSSFSKKSWEVALKVVVKIYGRVWFSGCWKLWNKLFSTPTWMYIIFKTKIDRKSR